MKKNYNEVNHFANRAHEALMGVWWSGLKMKQLARSFFRAHNVTDTQFNVLVVLKVAKKPLTQRELCERLLVDKSDLTGVLGRMEQAGLVTRRAVEGDRRCNAVVLTDAGRTALATAEPDYIALVTNVMSAFKPAETRKLTALMVRLHDAIDAADATATKPKRKEK